MGFWEKTENQERYAKWLGEQLGFKTMEDWYKIGKELIHNHFGGSLLSQYYNNSPSQFVKALFPDYPWKMSKFKKQYSLGQIEWLEFRKITKPDIIHILNNEDGEFKIPNSNYRADGWSERDNSILEYHGDFWHGNPALYNQEEINLISKKSYGELYQRTLKKQRFCEECGFNYTYIWESEWMRGRNAVGILQKKFKEYSDRPKYI